MVCQMINKNLAYPPFRTDLKGRNKSKVNYYKPYIKRFSLLSESCVVNFTMRRHSKQDCLDQQRRNYLIAKRSYLLITEPAQFEFIFNCLRIDWLIGKLAFNFVLALAVARSLWPITYNIHTRTII
jgi:hypothetical protein